VQAQVQLRGKTYLLRSSTTYPYVLLGVITAFMTNPLWVVKTRMFTTSARGEGSYRGILGTLEPSQRHIDYSTMKYLHMGPEKKDGLSRIYRTEGIRGLYKGTVIALFGVSNGAIQFMTYEELKRWGKERKKRTILSEAEADQIELVRHITASRANVSSRNSKQKSNVVIVKL
jgi:hypothetical protein